MSSKLCGICAMASAICGMSPVTVAQTTAPATALHWGCSTQLPTACLDGQLSSVLYVHSNPPVEGPNGYFYGIGYSGGTYGAGVVYKFKANGSYQVVHSFNPQTDGAYPTGGLLLASDGSFYGTTSSAGPNNFGTVFKVTQRGAFSVIHGFSGTSEGYGPNTPLLQGNDGALYGSTMTGGLYDDGTLFRITTKGVLTILYTFGVAPSVTGVSPVELSFGSDGLLYGATSNYGALFRLNSDQSVQVLHNFSTSDGYPSGPLALGHDGSLYGLAANGSDSSGVVSGTLYKISPDGTFTSVCAFSNPPGQNPPYPSGSITQLQDNSWIGVSATGATNDGYLFQIQPNGSQIVDLHDFGNAPFEAQGPMSGVVIGSDGAYYGYAQGASRSGSNVIFSYRPTGVTPPAIALTVNNASSVSVAVGVSASVKWSASTATTCTAGGPVADVTGWAGAKKVTGTARVTPGAAGTFLLSLVCSGTGGEASAFVTLTAQ